jgi:predicted HTH transcriptional regulator
MEILNNPDYRENQYLDYKKAFAFQLIDKNKIVEKVYEFRNDVCSFANADGGYLIYGIADEQGMASEIVGVDLADPDKFELDLRNKLTPIMPKVPPVRFHFVKLPSGKYIVVLFVDHDYYAPYLHIVDQKNYKITKGMEIKRPR